MARKKKESEEEPESNWIDPVKLDKFIILMYHPTSESRKKYQDYMERKRECAVQAGFHFDETFEEDVEEMLLGKNDEANRLIIDYVISLGSPDMIRYVAFQQMLASQVQRSMGETDEKAVKVIRENINNLSDNLKEIETNLFGDADQALRKALYSSMVDKLRLRPEHMAKAISEKNLKIKDEYYD
jgi:hypothetical protein